MSSLNGKVAIVLGGARGIGEACARRMLQEGAKVVVGDINVAIGEATCDMLAKAFPRRVCFEECDITVDSHVEALFDKARIKFGPVDILVVTAAILDEGNWKRMMEINLIGSISATKIAQEKMGKQAGQKGGHVVLLSSAAGLVHWGGIETYTASNHGLIGFVRSTGDESIFAETGVRVNAICPYIVRTSLLNNVVCSPYCRPEKVKEVLSDRAHDLSVEQVTDALMKLLLGKYNGSSMVFTKEGIVAFDEEKRLENFLSNMYESIER